MGKGGYHGGSSIVRLGPGGTSWDSGRDDAGKVVRRRKKKPKQAKPEAAAPKAPPIDTNRTRLIEGYLMSLARERTLNKPDSPPPKKLRKEIEAAGGINEWVRADSKRHAFYIHEAAKARAKLVKAATPVPVKQPPSVEQLQAMTVSWIVGVKRNGTGATNASPPKAIRPAIDAAGGTTAFIKEFERKHGPVKVKPKGKVNTPDE